MLDALLILLGKCISLFSKITNHGNGSTWPGHIALSVKQNFIKEILHKNPQLKIVLIAGTNGKTTTGKMITTILENNGKKVFQNTSGANLLNGIASVLIEQSNIVGHIDGEYGIFEVDENVLSLAVKEITPFAVVALNLFRDQLDRYGEIDIIAKKWKMAFENLPKNSLLILNADDPQIAYLGKSVKAKTVYFGLLEKSNNTILQHASDSIYCPNCQSKLEYKNITYSHLGDWVCPNCKLKRPPLAISSFSFYPFAGTYNKYNTLAAVLFAKESNFSEEQVCTSLKSITPAFGRQEKLAINGKNVQIFLAKNPASFNQSLETIKGLGAKHVLFVLNDRIPDGQDVSWIWDIDLEFYVENFDQITIAGDRVYDMGLRVQYSRNIKYQISNIKSNSNVKMFEDLKQAIQFGLSSINKEETLYILPTYSAMLEVRKILTGKKIL